MRRIRTILITVLLLAGSIPLLYAFKAYALNVASEIGDVLEVSLGTIEFGTVFPQERLEESFTIGLSENAQAASGGNPWADTVTSFSQGLRKNGTPVLANRSNPNTALGPAQTTGAQFDSTVTVGTFVSLGFGGTITLGFNEPIANGPGSDIAIYEVTGGTSSPAERVRVEASVDGVAWTLLAGGVTRDANVNLGSLQIANYVRLTDVSNPSPFEDTADGYDLDAVRAINQVGTIAYVVRQKPTCVDVEGEHVEVLEDPEFETFSCPEGATFMPVLCPYLSKHETTDDGEVENDSNGITAFHGLPGTWSWDTAHETEVGGALSHGNGDNNDAWIVDLKVPCFAGACAQDWPQFVMTESGNPAIDPQAYVADPATEGALYGCDLSINVTSLSG